MTKVERFVIIEAMRTLFEERMLKFKFSGRLPWIKMKPYPHSLLISKAAKEKINNIIHKALFPRI
jgi:hypothetical protein